MRPLFALLCIAFSIEAYGQNWIDKTFGFEVQKDVVYGSAINFNGESESLQMNIYTPTCTDTSMIGKRPLLVWIHGGAFLAGDKEDPSITRLCEAFAQRGYVSASISYRLGFVSSNVAYNCNYPNYNCVFAADSMEWIRAMYRGIQDGKGAVRYFVNRPSEYHIDADNIFVAGESAGAFIAMGIAYLDTLAERFPETYAQSAVPTPSSNAFSCVYNQGKSFAATIARPDLGDIEGTIEPTTLPYRIRAIGNMYGGMRGDLLQLTPNGRPKPALYSFHQPCDPVVPFNKGKIYEGLSWCMTNGYNCFAIANTPTVWGSKAIYQSNQDNGYGYDMEAQFTNIAFPFSFLFGQGSCLDQVNNPCHAYDNASVREVQLANFFASKVDPQLNICEGTSSTNTQLLHQLSISPNPMRDVCVLRGLPYGKYHGRVFNSMGQVITTAVFTNTSTLDVSQWISGLYIIEIRGKNGEIWLGKVWKQ